MSTYSTRLVLAGDDDGTRIELATDGLEAGRIRLDVEVDSPDPRRHADGTVIVLPPARARELAEGILAAQPGPVDRTWTVGDLIRALSAYPPDSAVLIAPDDEDGETPAEHIDAVRTLAGQSGRVVVYIAGRD